MFRGSIKFQAVIFPLFSESLDLPIDPLLFEIKCLIFSLLPLGPGILKQMENKMSTKHRFTPTNLWTRYIMINDLTSLQTETPAETLQYLVLQEEQSLHYQLLDPALEASDPVESLGQLVGSILVIAGSGQITGAETGQEQGQEQIQHLSTNTGFRE